MPDHSLDTGAASSSSSSSSAATASAAVAAASFAADAGVSLQEAGVSDPRVADRTLSSSEAEGSVHYRSHSEPLAVAASEGHPEPQSQPAAAEEPRKHEAADRRLPHASSTPSADRHLTSSPSEDSFLLRRNHSREGSFDQWDEQGAEQDIAGDGVHIPREATTTILRSHSSLRRRKRAGSEATLASLEHHGSSYDLLSPSAGSTRGGNFEFSSIMMLDRPLLVKILRYLPFKEQFRARQVCKTWFKAFMESELSSHVDLSGINKKIDDLAIFSISKICGPKLKYISIRNCWDVTDSGFQKFVANSPALEVLDMNSCWELTDRSVSDLVLCKGITRLDLSNCRKVSDITIASALDGVENLQELKVSYCKNLTNVTMGNIVTRAPNISILFLQRCTSISDTGFAFLRNPETPLLRLTVLSLSDCSFLTDEAVLSISKGCPNLRALNLTFCCALTPASIDSLVEGCPKLVSLDMSFCGAMVYDEGLETISMLLPELERLSFRSCIMVTKEGLDHLVKNSQSLKYVNPSNCKNLTKDVLATAPSHWKVLAGGTNLLEVEPSPHFPKTSADGKFVFGK